MHSAATDHEEDADDFKSSKRAAPAKKSAAAKKAAPAAKKQAPTKRDVAFADGGLSGLV